MNNIAKEEALEFLMSQKGGVISTLAVDRPQSSFVFYDADEDFSVYFGTVIDSRKYKNIELNNKVAFVVSTIDPPRTIQIEGFAEEVKDKAVVENELANYVDVATDQMKHRAPITKLNSKKGMILFRIKPLWLKWSNYSDSKSENNKTSVVLIDNRSV